MKKIILSTTIIALIFFSINTNGLVGEVYAWDDCPKGLVNDEYPGSCPRYVDSDENGICDHSEPAPEDRTDGVLSEPDSVEQINAPNTSVSNNTPAILAVTIPLTVLVGYTGLKKLRINKRI